MLLEFGLSDVQCSWWQSSCTNGIGMCLLSPCTVYFSTFICAARMRFNLHVPVLSLCWFGDRKDIQLVKKYCQKSYWVRVNFVFFLCVWFLCCQYQCKWLPGKTRLRNDLLCVEWDVKLCSHSVPHPRSYSVSWFLAKEVVIVPPCGPCGREWKFLLAVYWAGIMKLLKLICFVGLSVLGWSGCRIQLWNCPNVLPQSGNKR